MPATEELWLIFLVIMDKFDLQHVLQSIIHEHQLPICHREIAILRQSKQIIR